jgi:hypothetical protein
VLGRFLSADSIVPGAASGSGGGAGTLGVDSSSRLTTLTTDFYEFIGQVTQENQAVLQYGPFFQWSEKVRKDNPVPSGPLNPQALNRYSYVLNNPLRYIDPTGHLTDPQIMRYTSYNNPDKLKEFQQNSELYKVLQVLHFGDILYLTQGNNLFFAAGAAGLANNGLLEFSNKGISTTSIEQLLDMFQPNVGMGYILTREMGRENTQLALAQGKIPDSFLNYLKTQGSLAPPINESDYEVGFFAGTLIPWAVGTATEISVAGAVAAGCTLLGGSPDACGRIGTAAGSSAALIAAGTYPLQEGDRILRYDYDGGYGGMIGTPGTEVTIIRGSQIIEHSWWNTGSDYGWPR